MNILDLLILLPIAFFAYRGFKNGLIREVLGIVGIVLGVFLAFRYMDEAGAYIQPFFGEYRSEERRVGKECRCGVGLKEYRRTRCKIVDVKVYQVRSMQEQ